MLYNSFAAWRAAWGAAWRAAWHTTAHFLTTAALVAHTAITSFESPVSGFLACLVLNLGYRWLGVYFYWYIFSYVSICGFSGRSLVIILFYLSNWWSLDKRKIVLLLDGTGDDAVDHAFEGFGLAVLLFKFFGEVFLFFLDFLFDLLIKGFIFGALSLDNWVLYRLWSCNISSYWRVTSGQCHVCMIEFPHIGERNIGRINSD